MSTILCNFALENFADNPNSYDRKIAIPYRAGTLDERISNLTESRRSVIRAEVAELKDYIERLKSKILAVYQNLQNL